MSRKSRIEEILQNRLSPLFLLVEDESHQHHVPKNAETHIKLIAVSTKFDTLSRLYRHKLINQLLKAEFDQGLHALSMHLYTSNEWDIAKNSLIQSPACKDGYKHRETKS